jgi:signal transduction histidine kinase
MLFSTSAVALLIVAVFCFDSYFSRKAEIRSAEIQVNNLNQVLEEQFLSTFKRIDLALLFLRDQFVEEKIKKNGKDFNNILNFNLKRLPEIFSIKVVDENGEFQADDSGVISKANLRDREYFQQLKLTQKDELVISKPVISKTSGQLVMVLARPVFNHEHIFKGIILATIPVKNIENLFATIDLGKKGSLGLIHRDQTVYVRYPEPLKYGAKKVLLTKKTSDFLNSSLTHTSFRILSRIDGIDRIVSIRKIANTSLILFAGLSSDEFLAAWKFRTAVYILIILGLMFSYTFFLINFLRSMEELEEQRKQAMQSAKLSSLGEMASGIAHEINNPLTIISAAAHLMKKSKVETEEEIKHNRSVEKIISTVERIAKIVRGLKSFSRDSYNDPITSHSSKALVMSALELCGEKLKNRGIMLELKNIDNDFILCRETQIIQVLINLLSNSVDVLENCESKRITIETRTSAASVQILFCDSGPKIPQEIAEKMMQPFFTTKEVGKGTGLGLSISKGIIDGHKGRFFLDRTKNETTFVIELPAAQSDIQTAA